MVLTCSDDVDVDADNIAVRDDDPNRKSEIPFDLEIFRLFFSLFNCGVKTKLKVNF